MLPTEIAHFIAEMTGCFKLRDGVLVPQIPRDDPRRQMLTTIPKIVQSSRQEGADEILVSTVESTRTPNNIILEIGGTPATFKICSETRNPDEGYWIDHFLYEDRCIYMHDLYREVVFSFGNTWSRPYRKRERVVVECDGTATHVLYLH